MKPSLIESANMSLFDFLQNCFPLAMTELYSMGCLFSISCLRPALSPSYHKMTCFKTLKCRTQQDTETVARELSRRGVLCNAYHAGLKVDCL